MLFSKSFLAAYVHIHHPEEYQLLQSKELFFAAEDAGQREESGPELFIRQIPDDLRRAQDEQFGIFAHGVRDQQSEEIEFLRVKNFTDPGGQFILPLMEKFQIGLLDLREREMEGAVGVVLAVAVDDVPGGFDRQRRIDPHQFGHQFASLDGGEFLQPFAHAAIERGGGRGFQKQRIRNGRMLKRKKISQKRMNIE